MAWSLAWGGPRLAGGEDWTVIADYPPPTSETMASGPRDKTPKNVCVAVEVCHNRPRAEAGGRMTMSSGAVGRQSIVTRFATRTSPHST